MSDPDLSYAEIARRVGSTTKNVEKTASVARRAGWPIPPRRAPPTPETTLTARDEPMPTSNPTSEAGAEAPVSEGNGLALVRVSLTPPPPAPEVWACDACGTSGEGAPPDRCPKGCDDNAPEQEATA